MHGIWLQKEVELLFLWRPYGLGSRYGKTDYWYAWNLLKYTVNAER